MPRWGSLGDKSYPLVALIYQGLSTIYYNNSRGIKALSPATKLISKSGKALGTRLAFTRVKKSRPTDPNRKIWVG